MSDASSRLPGHPSLEQLRKQAKELLRAYRAGDPAAAQRVYAIVPRLAEAGPSSEAKLADAQFVIARELGFDSWPKLVHYVAALSSHGLEHFESLARDFVAAYKGDSEAITRLGERFAGLEQLRQTVQQRRRPMDDATDEPELTLPEARLYIANALGFESWAALAASIARPAAHPRNAPHGLSTRPPFYRIDWKSNTLEPRQPLTDADWPTIVQVIREHGITGVNANGQMTDESLERLSSVEHLTRLDLGGSKRITDQGLLHLARMPQLEELRTGYPMERLTDRGLEVLRHLPELKRFHMCWQHGISDAGIANLSFCSKIEDVNLLGSTTGDGAIAALRGKSRLRHFNTGRLVSDAGIPLLHDLPAFKTWQDGKPRYDLMSFGDAEPNFLMLDGPFTDGGLNDLRGLEGVFGLGFFWHTSALTPDGLKTLAELPNLGILTCDGKLCDDTAMRHIASVPGLRMLVAQGAVASDDGFVALSRSQTLEYLWGRECPNLEGRGFAAFADLPALKGLAVSCKRVHDDALASLPTFPSLRWLLPMDVTDDGFRHVGRCTHLERLTCMYCRDTGDEATEHIAGLSRLKHYYAGQTRITDRSLEILGGMTSLEEIELSACPGITDAGLEHLAGLPNLKKLSVDASGRVTRPGIAVFPPHVRVDFWT